MTMTLSFIVRVEQLQETLAPLEKIDKINDQNDNVLRDLFWSGVIHKFWIAVTLSCRLTRHMLVKYHGLPSTIEYTRREILNQAYQANIINDEKWLEMLRYRNKISRTHEPFAPTDEWCERITEEYLPLLKELLEYCQKLIDEGQQQSEET